MADAAGTTHADHWPAPDETSPFTGQQAPLGHRLNDAMWPWDNGASQPAIYTPSEEVGIVGTTLSSNIKQELNKYVFAGHALPSNLDLPSIVDTRTAADVLDSEALRVKYSELVS